MKKPTGRATPDKQSDARPSPFDLTASQVSEIQQSYERGLSRNQALLDEVEFVLGERLRRSVIKVHAIEKRIKTLESVIDKCRRKRVADFTDLTDIVGVRVVCLFKPDIMRIGQLIDENFDVVDVDDKLDNQNNSLGYTSVHYICKMPSRYQGPRYESAANLAFEVQVRTLCMHAWAAVSHYLDYKGDWDVPLDLKRALGALSGLFYVADNQFEQFYAAREESRKRADQSIAIQGGQQQDINLDTLSAFLRSQFPERPLPADTISELVQDIKSAGYQSIAQVKADLDRASSAFQRYEKSHPPKNDSKKFSAVGAARLTLVIASEDFREVYENDEFGGLESGNYRDPILNYCL